MLCIDFTRLDFTRIDFTRLEFTRLDFTRLYFGYHVVFDMLMSHEVLYYSMFFLC